MFYVPYVDITNDKQMFNFLKNHFEYWTMNSWNRQMSIANNVKMYNLDLSGDWATAISLLEAEGYDTIGWMIHNWEREHPGYEVIFNGRCGGYLVLINKNSNSHVLPDELVEAVDYEEYKRWCKEYWGTVKANRSDLIYYTRLVQSFDKLCDALRDYCDQLSRQTFEIIEMQRAVEEFNNEYADDLEVMEFQYLKCDEQGIVDLSEVVMLKSLTEAFIRLASRKEEGYGLEWLEDSRIHLKKL